MGGEYGPRSVNSVFITPNHCQTTKFTLSQIEKKSWQTTISDEVRMVEFIDTIKIRVGE